MKFYKDIVAEFTSEQKLAEKSGQGVPFHYHSWSSESIKRFWKIWTTNGALEKQFYPIDYQLDSKAGLTFQDYLSMERIIMHSNLDFCVWQGSLGGCQ
jgi:hypothetical protein